MYIYMYIIECNYLYKDSYKKKTTKKRTVNRSVKKRENRGKKNSHCWQPQDLFYSKKIISGRRIIAVSVLLRLFSRVLFYVLSFRSFYLLIVINIFCKDLVCAIIYIYIYIYYRRASRNLLTCYLGLNLAQCVWVCSYKIQEEKTRKWLFTSSRQGGKWRMSFLIGLFKFKA